jgi:peptide/nickel transport system permease protein
MLMVPTLIGITFLVFVLIAASPGGMADALDSSAGSAERARAVAMLDDRYGLRDPLVVQYLRWLRRVSPLRFGPRDQVAPDGGLLRTPRQLPEPTSWRWFVDSLPSTPRVATANVDRLACLGAADEYARCRAEFVGVDAGLRRALAASERANPGSLPDRSHPQWPELERAGRAAIQAWAAADVARGRFAAILGAEPFPKAGVPLIPGILSLAAPDLGTDIHSQPVSRVLGRALPVTLTTNLTAFLTAYAIAIPTGLWAALRRRGWFDISSRTVFVALWSVPVIWAGTLALMFLAGRDHLGLFPTSGLHSPGADDLPLLPGPDDRGCFSIGFALDAAWHLCLPVACLVYPALAVLSRQARAAVLENLEADHVRTARAKGVPEPRVVTGHILRNSLIPLITMVVQVFPGVLAGSVIVERVFSLPGMGSLMLTAIAERDREVILANTLLVAVLNMGALLLADWLYTLADPRIRFKGATA